jgi:two-component system chemotaxis response regulator CheB
MIGAILESDPGITVIGKVTNGREAVNFIETHPVKPDIVTTDINMPVMNGFDMIEHIMAFHPLPILIVTVLAKDANFMRALNLGALDIIEKPQADSWQGIPQVGQELIEKVKLLSRVKVITHLSGKKMEQSVRDAFLKKPLPVHSNLVVCMASSTGGPNTLLKLFKLLPANFPAPIFVVQHMSESFFVNGMIEWFRSSLNIRVERAEHGKPYRPQTVYIAPSDAHLILKKDMMIVNRDVVERELSHTADVLFESAARQFGSRTVAVVLTGSGEDGACGIRSVSRSGGTVIAQDEQSCVVFGMPRAAIATHCVEKILKIEDIARELVRII